METTTAENNKKVFLKPMPGRVIVQRDEPKGKTGLIYIPEKYKQLPTTGRVLAVGDFGQADVRCEPTVLIDDDGAESVSFPKHMDMSWLIGKRVVWGRFSGIPLFFEGDQKFDVLTYEEIVAVVEDDNAVLDLESLAGLNKD